ncbi:hypothetical protein BASA81_009985 [Batrachochytrium salamandrivorans]|nr:hypothetical protein BASA81_009985 [Batrachochytrium salamandrivorans]
MSKSQSWSPAFKRCLRREIPGLKGEERIQKCQYLKNRLASCAVQVHRSIVVEVRELTGSTQVEWDGKAKQFDERLGNLHRISNGQRLPMGWLMVVGGAKKKHIDDMTAVEMTKQALTLQDKTQESTARTQRILDETIQVGVTVQTELKHQGEKIHQAEEDVERIESNLRRADKQMRIFVRRMGNDKIFMLMILLLVVGIIVAIALTVLKKSCPQPLQGILCSAPAATSV